MHNKHLADQRRIPQENRDKIDEIHLQIDLFIATAKDGFNDAIYEMIEELENDAQRLWGFSVDPKFHRYKHEYKFKAQWVGKKYRCLTTGEEFVIPETVRETDCFFWAKAMLDVGRLYCYARSSNCEEVKPLEVRE